MPVVVSSKQPGARTGFRCAERTHDSVPHGHSPFGGAITPPETLCQQEDQCRADVEGVRDVEAAPTDGYEVDRAANAAWSGKVVHARAVRADC
jgi:hypothetical protein